jgi:hypothetical protein
MLAAIEPAPLAGKPKMGGCLWGRQLPHQSG